MLKIERSYYKLEVIMIKLENVQKKYKSAQVLNDISFSVKNGEIVAIIGASGCGKTTLLKCINGLEKIDAGKILIEDCDISEKNYNLRELRQNVGIVFQQFNLFPHMTVKQNITLAPLKVKKIKKNDAELLAKELLEKVGLTDKINSYPHELSGGQAQRVAIARTLAMHPKVILFDEPTSALDPHMKKEVLDVIKNLKNENIAIIIVTHEIKFAREIADKIIFIHNGEVIDNDTPENVIDSPKNQITKDFFESLKED